MITDHKPLFSLFKKNIRMLVQVLDYSLLVTYQHTEMIHLSDALSRLASHDTKKGKMIKSVDISIHSNEELIGFNPMSVEHLCQT